MWDILSFGLAFSFFYLRYPIENIIFERATGHLFLTRWIYAILGFPFIIFSLPLISSLLTRARPTAYDKFGNTVPVIGEISYSDDFMEDLEEDIEKDEVISPSK